MKRACITGGAGFIGSNLADRLISLGVEVVVLDDFRTGRKAFIQPLMGDRKFTLVEGDVLDPVLLATAMDGCDWVFHLQANADVRYGLDHPTTDLEQNTIATSRVLEAMRVVGAKRILFSSTGSVYGEPQVFPTPEDAPFPTQTSLYGASKLACEGLIEAYAAGFGFTAIVCRFVSILGERYTHGHVYDFFQGLRADPNYLVVLGNGKQEKSYLYIQDCIDAMMTVANHHENDRGSFTYNLGTDQTIIVDDSIEIITEFLRVAPRISHTGGSRGWIGDSPLILLDTTRIRKLGWFPRITIPDAIRRTISWLDEHAVLFERAVALPHDSSKDQQQ